MSCLGSCAGLHPVVQAVRSGGSIFSNTGGVHGGVAKKGGAAQDFIPPEEMARLLAQSGSETAKAQAAALEEAQRIQADNVGHRMLQAMGWKEGQGLGAGGRGRAAPVTAAGSTKAPYEKGGLGAAVSALSHLLSWLYPAGTHDYVTYPLHTFVPTPCGPLQ